jgi:hypothetical protein
MNRRCFDTSHATERSNSLSSRNKRENHKAAPRNTNVVQIAPLSLTSERVPATPMVSTDRGQCTYWKSVLERDAISARTRAALAAAKARGKQLGDYQRIAAAKRLATAARAEAVRPAIAKTAHLSARAAADELNRRRVKTVSGRQWHAMQVIRMRDRLGL